MSSLIVGGVAIPVAISSPAWTNADAVDRSRVFDNTFFAARVGGSARDWTFSTPPVSQTDAETYAAALRSPASVLCSGDIISIPTMCSPELLSGKPIRTGAGNRVTLDFALHEVQPAKLLLRYAPGDTIPGESFSRTGNASYRDATGNVATAATGVKRDSHYENGVRSLLLEEARTNICLQSEALGTTWVQAAVTIGSNVQTAPSGSVTADKIQEDSTNAIHGVTQLVTCATGDQTFSVWVRGGERTKCVVVMSDNTTGSAAVGVDLSNGTTFAHGLGAGSWTNISSRVEEWSGGWYRVFISGTRNAGTQALLEVLTWATSLSYVGTTGSGIYAWGAQLEVAAFGSSYIPTTTTSVGRNADSYSLPFAAPPQEMSVYTKFTERGTAQTASAFRLFQISAAAGGTPHFLAYAPGALYRTYHDAGVGAAFSTQATRPAIGDVGEVASRLLGDGSVDSEQSVNAAASTTSAQSAATPLNTAWSGQLLWLNSGGTAANTTGFTAIQSLKVIAGARSLEEMRSA